MNQCLRCSKPCEASAVFCENCRSLLRNEFRQGSTFHSSNSNSASVPTLAQAAQGMPLVTQESNEPQLRDDLARYSTQPLNIVKTPHAPGIAAPITPHPPTLDSFSYPDIAEQTMSRMSEAAQFISEVEPSNRRLPHASRLAPIRDISADIRRESTPLPRYAKMRGGTGNPERVRTPGTLPTIKDALVGRDSALDNNDPDLPDLWPWLDSEAEEKENEDSWATGTDPLISRHVPNSYDSARIEEEDIKRALAEGIPTSHDLRQIRPRGASSLRVLFAVLAVLAALALVADGVLLSVVVSHPRHASTVPNGPATAALTLTPNIVDVAKSEQQVQVHIVNFPPGHSVQLSHDIQEVVTTVGSSSLLTIKKNGSANATIIADSTWATGYDQVFAEDTTTHYIASAQLQVKSAEPSSPAHLAIVDQNGKALTSLNFGTGIQGSNLFQTLRLLNKGSGSITWSASSDQSWLIASPNQGMFGRGQAIEVAAQLANLTAGKHTGTITIANNVGPSQTISATVNVTALPVNVGAVLAPTPAVLTFTTTDGASTPPSAQVLTLNNPGKLPLNWTLSIASSTSTSNQFAFAHVLGTATGWLSTDLTGGTVLAGANQQIHVSVNSNSLLPGAYQGELMFNAPGAIDSPQTVTVSLTVQPHCGLVTNAGLLSFTAVQGQTNPGNQSLGLNETASCAGAPINWQAAVSSSGWLNITPGRGTLRGTISQFISVGASATGYAATPRPYFGFLSFTTSKSTQTVMVELIVQPPPAPGAPVMGATPLNLNFSNTSGQPNPKGQVVTITNTGGNTLYWKTAVTIIGPGWLFTSPTGGLVQPGQAGQVVINVDTSHLSPGTYAGQVTLSGVDSSGKPASGSGQIVAINLVVQPSCTLTQPSSSSLAFSGVQGGFNPISQSLLITGTGNCTWPLTLTASAASAPWLNVQFPSGNTVKGSGQSVSFVVGVNMSGLVSGPPLNASFTISATDSAGTIATGSPQQVSAALTVLPPCRPGAVSNLTFAATQGQASPVPQGISLSESGTCSRPVTWTATGDAGSSAWLSLSAPAPDTGTGTSLTVTANSASLAAGTYTGTITLSARDNNGDNVGSPQNVTVTLIVTNTVSGTVMACQPGPAPLCTTSAALPGASLTLFNSSNVQVATATANASGNYTFTNLASGTYSVTITGTDANSVHYSTSGIPLVVSASASGVNLQVFPG